MDNTISGQIGATYQREVRKAPQAGSSEGAVRAPQAPKREPVVETATSNSVSLSVHEATKQVVIRVTDRQTGKVVREIPPERYLDMVANFLASVDLKKGGGLDQIC